MLSATQLFLLVVLSCTPAAVDMHPRYPQPAMEAPLKIVLRKPCAFSGQRLLLTGKIQKVNSSHTFTLNEGGKLLVRTVDPVLEQIGQLQEGERISISGVLAIVESEKPIFIVGRNDIVQRLPSNHRDCACE